MKQIILTAAIIGSLLSGLHSESIPLHLPRPDGKPGNPAKPVKVYILAGQSNMVGMGDIAGLKPPHPSVGLSADPAIIPGTLPIGGAKLAKHGITEATASLHAGAYDPKVDYAAAKPVGTAAVALGTVSATLPTMEGLHTLVVRAMIDVPVTGNYLVHVGFGDSSHAVATVAGQTVYQKQPGGSPVITKIPLEPGKSHPLVITYLKGGSCAFWLEQVDIPFQGDLKSITHRDGRFSYVLDEKGGWNARNDVTYIDPRLFPERAPSQLSALSNNKGSIGPELGFGNVLGTFHGESVLLIKTAMGNRALKFDFRPPSSGRTEPDNKYETLEYQLMVTGVRETLAKIDKVVPGYQGQGYEIAGFGWFQGHKDSGSPKEEYEKHLVNLINDLRKEFKTPNMKAVVATVGFDGYRIHNTDWKGVWEAQMAVGDPKQHPEFTGHVASVDTRDFWREIEESPRSQGFHYNRNAETYLLVGEAMGRAMVRLLGGQAEEIPKSGREAKVAAELAAKAEQKEPTAEQKAEHMAAIRPMIIDGAMAAFLANPKNQEALRAELTYVKPAKEPLTLDGIVDQVVAYYRAAGISDYEWKPFGGDLLNATWDHHSFAMPTPPEPTKTKTDAPLLTYPAEINDWFQPAFDTKKAAWKSGVAPFGESAENVKVPDWYQLRRSPKTVTGGDVILLRQSFEVPALKEGHRYRIRVAGSAHNNYGEGFCLYLNGRLLNQSNQAVLAWRKQGGSPRGGNISPDFRGEFATGKVCIAVANFKTKDLEGAGFLPPGPPLSVWIEEQKLPPVAP